MIKEIIFATNNKHKIEEIRSHFNKIGIKILEPKSIYKLADVNEFGSTFRQNSLIKAQFLREKTSKAVIADDSGLIVPSLNGEPGIFSARYSGKNADDSCNRKKLIEQMRTKDLNLAVAYFVCVMTFLSNELSFQTEGKCYGKISFTEKGKYGFGYDRIFISDVYNTHMAELKLNDKNKISHRAIAIKKLINIIKTDR